jgi:hypothetical protein
MQRINVGAAVHRAYIERLTKATKREAGKDFTAEDYAYVPDREHPSTWKLRLTETPGGAPTANMVGRAIAAVTTGYRGERVAIPGKDMPKVKARLREAWREANPDKEEHEMPAGIRP